MSTAVQPAPSGTRCYQRRRPEHTLWYRLVQAHFETWLAVAAGSDATAPPAYVEPAFRRYVECGILGCGFARAFCKECGHDFVVAFSCHGRAVCQSCNTRRMVEAAAHLVDHMLLLRYCARPPFAREHWHQHDAEHLVYDIARPRPDGPRALVLTPRELIDQVAALVPPPRVHRHRYYGVLAPNAPLRCRHRAGIHPPNHCRRSNSISAWPGEQFLVARAGSPCVCGAPQRGFWVRRRSTANKAGHGSPVCRPGAESSGVRPCKTRG